MPDENDVQLISTGVESTVYRLLSRNGVMTILKKQRQKGHTNYEFEAYAYRRLHDLGAHVPRVISVDNTCLHMSAFSGEELDDKTHLYSDKPLFAAVAHDLALCRDVKFAGFGHAIWQKDRYVGECTDWQSYLGGISQDFSSPEMLNSGLQRSEISALQTYWEKVQPKIRLSQGMLVHGDFAMSAIFVKDDSYEGIIDFGDAFIGDPLMDIAYFRFKEITKDYGENLYKSLLYEYLAVTNLHIADVEEIIVFYMIYWALERLRHCPDEQLRGKFIEKTKVLCGLI